MRERKFARIASTPSSSSLAGRSFLGRARTIAIESTGEDRNYHFVDGIDLYDSNSIDLSTPFTTVGIGASTGAFGGTWTMSGIPLSNMLCVVSFDNLMAMTVEIEGIYYAWFEPSIIAGGDRVWTMKAKGGLASIIPGDCPFLPPPFVGRVDADNDGIGEGAPKGFSVHEPVLVSTSGEQSYNGRATQYAFWQVEYQSCDSDDENNDDDKAIRTPWNYLSKNCCVEFESEEDGDTGDGDHDPGPIGADCTGPYYCIVVCRKVQGGGLGGGQFNVWCYPVVNGQEATYCSQPPDFKCGCSNTDLAESVLPNPNTQPVGTTMFVKCWIKAGVTGNAHQPCSNYNIIA